MRRITALTVVLYRGLNPFTNCFSPSRVAVSILGITELSLEEYFTYSFITPTCSIKKWTEQEVLKYMNNCIQHTQAITQRVQDRFAKCPAVCFANRRQQLLKISPANPSGKLWWLWCLFCLLISSSRGGGSTLGREILGTSMILIHTVILGLDMTPTSLQEKHSATPPWLWQVRSSLKNIKTFLPHAQSSLINSQVSFQITLPSPLPYQISICVWIKNRTD